MNTITSHWHKDERSLDLVVKYSSLITVYDVQNNGLISLCNSLHIHKSFLSLVSLKKYNVYVMENCSNQISVNKHQRQKLLQTKRFSSAAALCCHLEDSMKNTDSRLIHFFTMSKTQIITFTNMNKWRKKLYYDIISLFGTNLFDLQTTILNPTESF